MAENNNEEHLNEKDFNLLISKKVDEKFDNFLEATIKTKELAGKSFKTINILVAILGLVVTVFGGVATSLLVVGGGYFYTTLSKMEKEIDKTPAKVDSLIKDKSYEIDKIIKDQIKSSIPNKLINNYEKQIRKLILLNMERNLHEFMFSKTYSYRLINAEEIEKYEQILSLNNHVTKKFLTVINGIYEYSRELDYKRKSWRISYDVQDIMEIKKTEKLLIMIGELCDSNISSLAKEAMKAKIYYDSHSNLTRIFSDLLKVYNGNSKSVNRYIRDNSHNILILLAHKFKEQEKSYKDDLIEIIKSAEKSSNYLDKISSYLAECILDSGPLFKIKKVDYTKKLAKRINDIIAGDKLKIDGIIKFFEKHITILNYNKFFVKKEIITKTLIMNLYYDMIIYLIENQNEYGNVRPSSITILSRHDTFYMQLVPMILNKIIEHNKLYGDNIDIGYVIHSMLPQHSLFSLHSIKRTPAIYFKHKNSPNDYKKIDTNSFITRIKLVTEDEKPVQPEIYANDVIEWKIHYESNPDYEETSNTSFIPSIHY
ncbi:hypothetical protein QUF75_14170 [Desulfococcaceae bacterium HSG7]|nr:hypothetical protein [Desulfococcaceae bacterium HSG7]